MPNDWTDNHITLATDG